MKKIRKSIEKIIEWVLISLLGIMVINVLWQVFSRFFTSNPSSFTDELARYLMIWLGILGAAYVAGKNEHVAIDFFAKKFSASNQKLMAAFDFYKHVLQGYVDDYPLWIAAYSGGKARVKNIPWTFHQFSDNVRVNGITANRVDGNDFNGSLRELDSFRVRN